MKNYLIAAALMALASLGQFVSLALFNSLVLSFFLYTLLAGLFLPFWYIRLLRKLPLRQIPAYLKLLPESPRQVRFALILGTSMAMVMYLAFILVGDYFLKDGAALPVVAQWGIHRSWTSFLFLFALLLNGATEELFWRGLIHEILHDEKRRVLAVLFPALVFGAQHIFVIWRLVPNVLTTLLFMIGIIGSGLLWGYLREKTGSLFVCVLCHVIVAFGYLSILAFYLFR
ncbi:MAG: CPBP family intramembrane metalloprotease [Spirochaetes bacterium]|nr:CPBP family intramembrane metalloprotease [Spirochaetota bacterium]